MISKLEELIGFLSKSDDTMTNVLRNKSEQEELLTSYLKYIPEEYHEMKLVIICDFTRLCSDTGLLEMLVEIDSEHYRLDIMIHHMKPVKNMKLYKLTTSDPELVDTWTV